MNRNFNWCLVMVLLTAAFILNGCKVGGSQAFIPGDSPEDNNALSPSEPTTGDWIVANLLDEPENLNPYISSSASATMIYSGYIYEAFLTTKRVPPWDDEPLLAVDLPIVSEDHLRYEWHLRPEAHWNDGTPMTMEDAVFSLKAIMNPYVDDLPSKPYYKEVDSLAMPDDHTLIMYCSQPYFLHIEFLGSFSVMPKHVFDAEGLMNDLSFFQVVRGGAFGKVADVLEANPDLSWDELLPAIVVYSVEKSISNLTEEALTWKDLKQRIDGFDNLSKTEQLAAVRDLLKSDDAYESAYQFTSQTENTARQALNTLPIVAEITSSAQPGTFPKREELKTDCRDIHSRIEKFGNDFNTHPNNREPFVGSGPYNFESWKTGQEIVLNRNKDYWRGDGYGYIDRIIWRVLTDQTASLVALKNGEIDLMQNLTTIQYLTMTNRKKFLDDFIKTTYIVPSYGYLGWRCGHPIFKDKRVRRAMTHMVRRKDMGEKLLFGFAEIVTGPFYRYGQDYDSTIVPYEYDPEKAMALLKEAGWADVDNDGILEKDSLEFKFELLVPSGSPFAEQLASILREDLFMIGVQMEIRRLEWSVFINNYIRNHDFDACYLGWVFGMRGDPKQVWHSESSTGRGSNHVEFRNAEVDSLIDAARVEFDLDKRVAMYHRFQQILHEEQPYTFLFSTMRKPAYDRRFKNVKFYPFRPGFQLDEWYVPKDEQKFSEG